MVPALIGCRLVWLVPDGLHLTLTLQSLEARPPGSQYLQGKPMNALKSSLNSHIQLKRNAQQPKPVPRSRHDDSDDGSERDERGSEQRG